MTNAPDIIWLKEDRSNVPAHEVGPYNESEEGVGTEYVRRDREPPAPVEAGVVSARGIGELHSVVSSLASTGFRIVTVIDTQNGDYHVVAQKDPK